MSRPKKDGVYINYYLNRQLAEQLRDYAEEKGQTTTMALERILQEYFQNEGQGEKDVKK